MIIFGYGSLVNIDSLQKTLPGIKKLNIGWIKGFRRNLNLRAIRIVCNNVKGVVMDIEDDKDSIVNGVYFEINENELKELQKREILYDFIEVDVYTKEGSILKALTVQAKKMPRASYLDNCEKQKRYLDTCLKGAKNLGQEFYQEFLEITFVGKTLLKNFLEI